MEAPCPVRPQGPWSPAGYRVVEIFDEIVPATRAGSPSTPSRSSRESSDLRRPSLAYRVVEVAEEWGPPVPQRPSPNRRVWKLDPLRCAVLAAGASALVVVAIIWLVVDGPAGPDSTVLPPREAAGKAFRTGPVCVVPDAGKACKPADRETFGTAVQFVRTPAEAARIAGQEGKLAFLLHVSGNFEDERFT